jgi:steroid 5-alpha reductase family enzyme
MTAPVPSTSERSPATRNRTALVAVVVALVVGAGLAVAGSFRGAQVGGIPVFAIAVTAAFVIQFLVFIPSAVRRTERFFDLTGSLTFIAVSIALALLAPAQDARGWILAAMVVVWAARLGSFLFARVHRAGTDGRFDEIKTNPLRFFQVWCIQGLWVALTASAAWIAMSADAADRAPLDGFAVAGIVVWLAGMVFEVVADLQKQAFRANPANKGEFIRTGLWSRSRHPNYFGEILVWVGVFVVAVPVLQGWQWVAVLSPLFVVLLLTRVSGIPLLEKRADERWGDRADYRAYRDRTPVLIPALTARSGS